MSDKQTIQFLRLYQEATPRRKKAIAKMLRSVAVQKVPIDRALERYMLDMGWPEADARHAAAQIMNKAAKEHGA
jgi:hypothetical protein